MSRKLVKRGQEDPNAAVEDEDDDIALSPGVDPAEVKELISTFNETVKTLQHRPVEAAPKADPNAAKAKAQETLLAAKAKANELAAAGEFGDAMWTMYEGLVQANQGAAVKVEDTPGYKSLFTLAKRAAKSSHADLFKTYEAEILTAVDGLPADDRINPDAWEQAITQVRAAHFDEILESKIKERNDTEQAALADQLTRRGGTRVPVARGQGTPRTKDNADLPDLDDEQIYVAEQIGMTPENYAKALKSYNARRIGLGSVRLIDDTDAMNADGTLKPGRF